MSLKQLSKFNSFDASRFFNGKDFLFSKAELWQQGEDRDHMQTLGTKITGVIFRDRVEYGRGETEVNRGESVVFKVSQPLSTFSDWKQFNTIFRVNSVTKAVVYGDFRNQLSVTVPRLQAVSGAGVPKKGV